MTNLHEKLLEMLGPQLPFGQIGDYTFKLEKVSQKVKL